MAANNTILQDERPAKAKGKVQKRKSSNGKDKVATGKQLPLLSETHNPDSKQPVRFPDTDSHRCRRKYQLLDVLCRFAYRILFFLSFPATQTLGGRPLVTKGRPDFKVFAPLAPFNRQPLETPHGDITKRTDALILAGNNVGTLRSGLSAHDTVFVRLQMSATSASQVMRIVDKFVKIREFHLRVNAAKL